MRFPVDATSTVLGAAQWFFLFVLCVLLPLAAMRQHRVLAGGRVRLRRMEVYASGLATHLMLIALTWLAARHQPWTSLLPAAPRIGPGDVAIGLASLALGVVPFLWRRTSESLLADRTRFLAPRAAPEFAAFYTLSVSAGIAEELAYRGVLFVILAALTGSWWAAAVVAAAAFGIAHLFQGWRSAGLAVAWGLRDHVVVGLTGTLWIPVIVHMLHDIIAGTVVGLRARRGPREDADALP